MQGIEMIQFQEIIIILSGFELLRAINTASDSVSERIDLPPLNVI